MFWHIPISATTSSPKPQEEKKIVTSVKRIHIPTYSEAYNPSIIKYGDGYLMTFRYLPDRHVQPWISNIGIVKLDEFFEPISPPQLLDTRLYSKNTPPQSEDARIFSFKGKIYLIFNDNIDSIYPSAQERRDIYVAELICKKDQFSLSEPLKLYHEEYYETILWQKNWSPFVSNDTLLLSYSLNPREILTPNFTTGNCQKSYETLMPKTVHWPFGQMHGGTFAQAIEGEYLAFFHSRMITSSPSSNNVELWHYFMGAYSFSAQPPFEITKITTSYIDHPSFYTNSPYNKRVIYPGGYVSDGSDLYVAYGKDDCEVWIATIDFEELKKSMVPVQAVNVGEIRKLMMPLQ